MTEKIIPAMKSALISPCGRYRYWLKRRWTTGIEDELVFVMLNPSTADASQDDATIRKCMGFARRLGYRGITVVNLFALRSTKPVVLGIADDPVGPENDTWIAKMAYNKHVICAWGPLGARDGRDKTVLALLRGTAASMRALRLTKDGHPGHPLYIPYDTKPVAIPRFGS